MKTPSSIAVIGAGSSGLITLKNVISKFPSAHVSCYEQSESIRGSWGKQRDGFVSTSTRYATQFSCFREAQAVVSEELDYREYFRGKEYGDYLERFAKHFNLQQHIHLKTRCTDIHFEDAYWTIWLHDEEKSWQESFDALFLCTGLVHMKNAIQLQEGSTIVIPENPEDISHSRVVIVGGGESASDLAHVLADPERNNEVYLSLRSGIRVSPRYHPIRSVPSDFLRNRLLLSIGKNIRNYVGEHFVATRIKYERFVMKLFPSMKRESAHASQSPRKHWDLTLKAAARDKLFNVFHNKSDDFLADVDAGRLQIIGPAIDDSYNTFYSFDRKSSTSINADYLVPTMGYQSILSQFADGTLHLKDFYHGCVHTHFPNLFLVGFARPIIGNIPSISEMQARYATGVLAGDFSLPENAAVLAREQHRQRQSEYPGLPTETLIPVEYIPYCDTLARCMGIYPTKRKLGSWLLWWKVNFIPASTQHYVDEYFDENQLKNSTVYSPPLLLALLCLIRSTELCFLNLKHYLSSSHTK